MATKAGRTRHVRAPKSEVEILKDMLIVQLGLAGVPQDRIRQIVICDANRVAQIVKHLKPKKAK